MSSSAIPIQAGNCRSHIPNTPGVCGNSRLIKLAGHPTSPTYVYILSTALIFWRSRTTRYWF